MSPEQSDQRFVALLNWLKTLHMPAKDLTPASNDASFRRYFRFNHEHQSYIVMDAPPDKENVPAFIEVAAILKNVRVRVPEIYALNESEGFLLLEDFGSQRYLDLLSADSADELYGDACDCLFTLQTGLDVADLHLPEYDASFIYRELNIFYDWFLDQWLALKLPDPIATDLNTLLIDSAMRQPRVFVHRDFHSRNLMVLPNRSTGVIDFQDAVIGPVTYDLVSLLRDCYVNWPPAQVEQWLLRYYRRLAAIGAIAADSTTFRRWFDLMGLQRHLKAIGIFSRLHLRDQRSSYLHDIPRTLGYVFEISKLYPELSDFHTFLQENIPQVDTPL